MLRYLLVLALLLPMAACDSNSADPMGNQIGRVYISEVEIEFAPSMRPNGDDWDGGILGIGNDPDIYFDLVNDDSGGIIESTEGDDFSDVDSQDFPLVWVFTPEILFTRFSSSLAFDIWDSDNNADDFMGNTEAFTIQQIIDNGALPLFTIQSTDGLISVRILLRYER